MLEYLRAEFENRYIFAVLLYLRLLLGKKHKYATQLEEIAPLGDTGPHENVLLRGKR